jgi:hypothetical protein
MEKGYGKLVLLVVTTLLLWVGTPLRAADPPKPQKPKTISKSRADAILAGPTIKSDEDRLKELMAIRQYIREIFIQGWKYDVEFFELLDAEAKLVEELRKNPDYDKLIRNRPELLDIRIQFDQPIRVEATTFKAGALELWKKSLLTLAKKAGSENKIQPLAWAKTQLTAATRDDPRSLSVLVSLVRDGDMKKRVSTEKDRVLKLEMLRQYFQNAGQFQVPIDKIPGFASNKTSETFSNTTPRDLIEPLMESIVAKENLLLATMIFRDKNADMTWAELQTRLALLDQADFVQFWDAEDFLKPTLHLALGEGEDSKPVAASLAHQIGRMQERYPKETKSYSATSLLLREVPPYIGSFRGGCAQNCSTQLSFPYPYDPHERVFFIYDPENLEEGPKGMLTGTTVERSDGKEVFYAITLDGPRISPADAITAIHALDNAKAQLGVEEILLPNKNRLDSLVNHPKAKAGIEQLLKNAREVPITYLNPEVRKTIQTFETYNGAEYDHIEQNPTAMSWKPMAQFKGASTPVTVSPIGVLRRKALTKEQVIEFALEVAKANHHKQEQRALEAVGLDPEKFGELKKAIENDGRLRLTPQKGETGYFDEIRKSLKQIGIRSEAQIESLLARSHLFYLGRLKALDAFSGDHIKETRRQMITDLKLHLADNENPEAGWDLFHKHAALIFQGEAADLYFSSLLHRDGFDEGHLSTLLDHVFRSEGIVEQLPVSFGHIREHVQNSILTHTDEMASLPWSIFEGRPHVAKHLIPELENMAKAIGEIIDHSDFQDRLDALDLYEKVYRMAEQIGEQEKIKKRTFAEVWRAAIQDKKDRVFEIAIGHRIYGDKAAETLQREADIRKAYARYVEESLALALARREELKQFLSSDRRNIVEEHVKASESSYDSREKWKEVLRDLIRSGGAVLDENPKLFVEAYAYVLRNLREVDGYRSPRQGLSPWSAFFHRPENIHQALLSLDPKVKELVPTLLNLLTHPPSADFETLFLRAFLTKENELRVAYPEQIPLFDSLLQDADASDLVIYKQLLHRHPDLWLSRRLAILSSIDGINYRDWNLSVSPRELNVILEALDPHSTLAPRHADRGNIVANATKILSHWVRDIAKKPGGRRSIYQALNRFTERKIPIPASIYELLDEESLRTWAAKFLESESTERLTQIMELANYRPDSPDHPINRRGEALFGLIEKSPSWKNRIRIELPRLPPIWWYLFPWDWSDARDVALFEQLLTSNRIPRRNYILNFLVKESHFRTSVFDSAPLPVRIALGRPHKASLNEVLALPIYSEKIAALYLEKFSGAAPRTKQRIIKRILNPLPQDNYFFLRTDGTERLLSSALEKDANHAILGNLKREAELPETGPLLENFPWNFDDPQDLQLLKEWDGKYGYNKEAVERLLRRVEALENRTSERKIDDAAQSLAWTEHIGDPALRKEVVEALRIYRIRIALNRILKKGATTHADVVARNFPYHSTNGFAGLASPADKSETLDARAIAARLNHKEPGLLQKLLLGSEIQKKLGVNYLLDLSAEEMGPVFSLMRELGKRSSQYGQMKALLSSHDQLRQKLFDAIQRTGTVEWISTYPWDLSNARERNYLMQLDVDSSANFEMLRYLNELAQRYPHLKFGSYRHATAADFATPSEWEQFNRLLKRKDLLSLIEDHSWLKALAEEQPREFTQYIFPALAAKGLERLSFMSGGVSTIVVPSNERLLKFSESGFLNLSHDDSEVVKTLLEGPITWDTYRGFELAVRHVDGLSSLIEHLRTPRPGDNTSTIVYLSRLPGVGEALRSHSGLWSDLQQRVERDLRKPILASIDDVSSAHSLLENYPWDLSKPEDIAWMKHLLERLPRAITQEWITLVEQAKLFYGMRTAYIRYNRLPPSMHEAYDRLLRDGSHRAALEKQLLTFALNHPTEYQAAFSPSEITAIGLVELEEPRSDRHPAIEHRLTTQFLPKELTRLREALVAHDENAWSAAQLLLHSNPWLAEFLVEKMDSYSSSTRSRMVATILKSRELTLAVLSLEAFHGHVKSLDDAMKREFLGLNDRNLSRNWILHSLLHPQRCRLCARPIALPKRTRLPSVQNNS